MNKRLHVFYAGQVQGVGFRFAVQETAEPRRLTGWVANLRDRRVEAVLEGEEERLKEFLSQMRVGPMHRFIQKVDVSWSPATGEFTEFDIRYF